MYNHKEKNFRKTANGGKRKKDEIGGIGSFTIEVKTLERTIKFIEKK